MEELNKLDVEQRVKAYRKYDALNQSFLKDMNSDPQSVIAPDYDFTRGEGMITGDMIDLLAFSGEEALHNNYMIEQENLATGKVKDIVDWVFEHYGNDRRMIEQDAVLEQAFNEIEYYGNREFPSRKREFFKGETAVAYYNHLCDATGKTLVKKEWWDNAQRCYQSLVYGDDHIQEYMNLSSECYQQVFIQELEGVKVKGLADIAIRSENKIRDLKFTSFNPATFEITYLKFKYYLQVMYGYLMAKELDIEWHEIDFGFILVNPRYKPVEIILNTADIEFAYKGFTLKNGYFYKGIKHLIEDYKFHLEHSKFAYPVELHDGKMNFSLQYESGYD